MNDYIIYADDDNFDAEVISSTIPVLVDFFATWCGPCKMVSAILDEVAKEHSGKIKVVKVDVDKSPETAKRYGIRGIPTLALFKDGTLEATQVGAVTKAQLNAFINANS